MSRIRPNIYGARKGSALALALVMVTVVSMILTSLLGYITSQVSYSKDRVERERAFQVAEAGIFFYRWYLAHEISGRTAEQIKDFWETVGVNCPLGVCSAYEADFKDHQGNVIGKYRLEVQKPQLGSTIVTATSTGWTSKKPSAKRTVKVRFRRPSWSENIVLANDNMRFGSGTAVNGRIHSNLGIRFDGVATNVVSSSLPSYDDLDHDEIGAEKLEFGVHTHKMSNGTIIESYRPNEVPPHSVDSRPDVFQAGRQFPVAQMSFDSVISDISYMRTQAVATGTKFDNSGAGRMIELKIDGTFDMFKVNTYSSSSKSITGFAGKRNSDGTGNDCTTSTTTNGSDIQCRDYDGWLSDCYCPRSDWTGDLKIKHIIPDNGVIFVANNIWLKGSINGKRVSIVAAELSDEPGYAEGAKDVYLGMTDLLYTNANGNDIIGIIAQDNIDIIRNSENSLEIDAALLAKEGRVGRGSYSGVYKDTITVNGSIATNERYGFAYVGEHQCDTGIYIANGYCHRNLNFDNNLLYYPPPYFPTGTEYAIDQWEEL